MWYHELPRAWKYELDSRVVMETRGVVLDVELSPVEIMGVGGPVAQIYPGRVIGLAGYRWDGSTGGVDSKDMMRPSLGHDILCQAIREGLIHAKNQPKADRLLRMWLSQAQHLNRVNRPFLSRQLLRPWHFVRRWYVWVGVRVYQRGRYGF